jgi:tRNA (adenine37-N6)-methyltransferase
VLSIYISALAKIAVLELKTVGYVRVEHDDEYVKAHAGEVKGRVEILPEYGEALDGLEGYSHIFIISVFHKAPPSIGRC